MRNTNFLCSLAILATALTSSGTAAKSTDDDVALTRLGQTYAQGFYMNDPAIILSTTHTELSKKGVWINFWGQTVDFLEWLQGDRLYLAGLYHDHEDKFDETTPSEVKIYDVGDGVAMIELIAADWYDGFTAVKVNGEWKLLDCVWGQIPEYESADVDNGEAITAGKAVQNFALAVGESNRELLDNVIHQNISVRGISAKDGHDYVMPITREQLYFGANPIKPLVKSAKNIEVTVFNATKRTALAKITADRAQMWVQLLKLNDEWRVINVHWNKA